MPQSLHGIVPVMITPFTEQNAIDWEALDRLVDWYIANGADTLFAVCLSSEMFALSLEERVALARAVVGSARGRVPVIASGHVSDDFDAQNKELGRLAETGIDALVLVTNRLDPANAGPEAFAHGVGQALNAVPSDLALGLYECPVPARRLLSDDEFKMLRDTGRFRTLKDVSCDLETVTRRCAMAEGSDLAVVNANAAIAADAMRAGSKGFSGVFTNLFPDLYAWLYRNKDSAHPLCKRLEVFLALAGMAESMGYPKLAKRYHQRLGTLSSIQTRVVDYDLAEQHWAFEALLDHMMDGAAMFRDEIAALPAT